MDIRVGFGFDVHEFAHGRPLILGGVNIPHDVGLMGHSDADAVTHAVVDALMGAAGLGDIGQKFPDTDPDNKDEDSRNFLKAVYWSISEMNYSVSNIDVTIVTQAPKIAPHAQQMRENLASDLEVEIDRINVKATTTENLGFVGRKEGLAVWAVATLVRSAS